MNDKFKVLDHSGDRKYFTMIPNYIINHSTAYEQAIYLYMKRTAGEKGTCWLSPIDIANSLGCSSNTVRKYQKELLRRGWIKIIGSRGKTKPTNEYEIVDLWDLNMRHYVEKHEEKESSNNEQSPKESSNNEKKVQPLNLESSTIGNKEDIIKKNYNNIYTRIFSFWNSKNIVAHRKLTDKMKRSINGRLRDDYQEDEIKTAIENYSIILNGQEFFWNHRWTLQDFLQRGFDKFLDINIAKENYKKRSFNEGYKNPNQATEDKYSKIRYNT